MWNDPIVEEVRKAGEELAKQVNYDLHAFFQALRKNEKQCQAKVVSRSESTTTRPLAKVIGRENGSSGEY